MRELGAAPGERHGITGAISHLRQFKGKIDGGAGEAEGPRRTVFPPNES